MHPNNASREIVLLNASRGSFFKSRDIIAEELGEEIMTS